MRDLYWIRIQPDIKGREFGRNTWRRGGGGREEAHWQWQVVEAVA
jgi:hypothetical protein